MRDNPRTPVLSAIAGLVLLGGMVAFTVVVPRLGDESGSATTPASGASAGDPIDLPDELPGGLTAIDLGTLPDDLASNFPAADDLRKQEASIADGLQEVFDAPGAFRLYATSDASALAQVTVLDKAPGLFAPDTPPIDPAVLGVTRASSELVAVDGAVCSISYGEGSDVPAGQQVDPAQQPQTVRCQLGAGERTYEGTTRGLTAAATVDLLQGLADA